MDWILFWTAFGAIGGTLGAVGTATAVIVALWQVKHAEKKKLKLSFSDSMIMPSQGPTIPEETFISLSIVNIGNRNIVVQHWGFDYHRKVGHAVLGINQSLLALAINPRLPCELAIENKIDLFLEKKYFIENLRKGVKEKRLKPWLKLTFFVMDSAGKTYRIKSKKTVQKMLQ